MFNLLYKAEKYNMWLGLNGWPKPGRKNQSPIKNLSWVLEAAIINIYYL
jgi:hypothetical protein